MAVGTMIARLIAVTGQFHREMDGAKKKLEKFEKTALAGSAAMAAGMAVATVAATAGGVAAVKLAAQWEQAEIAFTTLLGTAEEAKEFLVELDRFASVTPFELPGIMDASRKLLAFGWHAESVVPTMTAVGDAVAALGGGEAEIASVVRALGQMRAKGAVAAQEVTRQLAEVGIPAWDYLAKAIGTTVPEAMSLVERRAISASVGIKAILEGMTRSFGGAMEKQSRTMIGMWSTAKDEARAIGRGLGAYLAEAFNIKGVLGGFIAAMRGWANIIRGAETNAEGFREILRSTFPPSVRVAIVALAGAVGGTLIPVFLAAGKAIWAAALALAPFMLKGAAIAVTAYLIYRAWSSAGSGIAAVSVFMIRMAAAVVGVFGMLSPALRGVAARINAYADSVAAASVPAAAMAKAAEDAKKQQDNLAQSSMQAAAAQDALGKSTEDAAKQANGGIMAFDQVHRLQEQMANAASPLPGMDAFEPGEKFRVEGIEMPKIDFEIGPLGEMAKAFDNLRTSLASVSPLLEGVGYVIAGIVTAKTVILIAELARLAVTATMTAATVVGAWAIKAAAVVASGAVQIGTFVMLIGKWAALAIAAVANTARIAGAWVLQKIQAAASLAVQVPAFVMLIGKWAALAIAATVNAAKMAAAWFIALGPVGWVIATIVALVALIALNWGRVKETTQRIWGTISTFVSDTWADLRSSAVRAWDTIRGTICDALATVVDRFNSFKTSVSDIFSGIWDSVTGWVDRIVTSIKGMLRWIGIGGDVSGGGSTATGAGMIMPPGAQLNVPHLATGGIVRKPTLAMIGEGRHSEAVVPLKPGMNFGGDNADAIGAAVYKAVRDAIRVSRIEQGRESERQEISIELDGAKLGRALVPLLRREGQRTGVVVT